MVDNVETSEMLSVVLHTTMKALTPSQVDDVAAGLRAQLETAHPSVKEALSRAANDPVAALETTPSDLLLWHLLATSRFCLTPQQILTVADDLRKQAVATRDPSMAAYLTTTADEFAAFEQRGRR